MRTHSWIASWFLLLPLAAQTAAPTPEPKHYEALQWRCIGPFRGGRVAAVCGVRGQPDVVWFGGTGGGVWKSGDGGRTFDNVSDGFFGGSIGAVAVAESDPNVVYVGGGEKTVRGNVSHGSGLWKSLDAGKTWTHLGMADAHHIPRVRVHPRDPDLVYVAVLGHLHGPGEARGVFRSRDGGRTFARVLFANADAGAVDLCLDPTNPRILYATTWRVRRTPHGLESGGPGSGIWRSHDGGDTWTELTRNEGLPQGVVGICGVAVAPTRPERVFAIVEAEDGGVFRSDDAGQTWTRVNADRALRQRAWYYTRIYADPRDADVCYVLNVAFHRSKDGGRTFAAIGTPHGDNHDLWIDPDDAEHWIEGNDGGACVTFDAGRTWTAQDTQPTAQFYRVATDNHFPYRIYGAQQDNSTVRIAHRTEGGGIGVRDWEPTAGGESGWLAPHPVDPEIVFGGSYGGFLERRDHRRQQSRNVNVWPDNPMGHGAADLRYRFQWNFPILFSPHDPDTLYAAANVLFQSRDQGHSWQAISPDLTRADPARMQPSGGPITKDNTGVEYYCTIFALCESPLRKGLLWCGSDDGLLHVRDGAEAAWVGVTPPELPEWARINSIEPHPQVAGGLYLAATRYQSDDFTPYLFRTLDLGRTWTRIDAGIPRDHFTRVVRADPRRPGLLYAGTEAGVYVSFDDGAAWRPLQRNLPIVPITDLAVRDGDLIAATQGRSFWVLDGAEFLHQAHEAAGKAVHLFRPRPAWRLGGGAARSRTAGQNPPAGVVFHVWLAEAPGARAATLTIRDAEERVVRRFSSAKRGADEAEEGGGDARLDLKAGCNRVVWDMRWPGARRFPGLVLWGGGTGGPTAVPGTYRATLEIGGESQTVACEIRADPRATATSEEYRAQLDFLLRVRDKLSQTHDAIRRIRTVRGDLDALGARAGDVPERKELRDAIAALQGGLGEVEQALYQTRNQSPQDPLNFPIRWNNRLSALAGVVAQGEFPPTTQALAVEKEITTAIDAQLARLEHLLGEDLSRIEEAAVRLKVPQAR
ncbi:MAG: glycosyl hydrolase [Planctomycetes bacterium]|nr:glycosyl hydrolase [Planctomycetota bacterium]